MKQLRSIALALAVTAGLGCKPKGTFVHVVLHPAQTEPTGIKSVELQLVLGGQSDSTTLREPGGGDIAFPTDITLQVGSGAGQLTITAIARGASGKELDRGVTTATVATGAIAEVAVALAGGKADLQPSEATHDFGQVQQGQTGAVVNLSFINAGYKPSGTLSTVLGGVGAGAFTIGADTCAGTTLAPSTSCSVGVTFHPLTPGALAATVAVTGLPGGTGTVAITGTGTASPQTLTVVLAGTGAGVVTATPGGLTCSGSTCSASYPYGTSVTLTAQPATGSTFDGWSTPGCTGTGSCIVAMTQARSVPASFSSGPQTLTVTVSGSGQGTVLTDDKSIQCSSGAAAGCQFAYPYGSGVTLRAVVPSNSGSHFSSWGGACSGITVPTCTVSMSSAQSVSAVFNPAYQVTVAAPTLRNATVTSTPAGIACSSVNNTCTALFDAGSVVHLAAATDSTARFNGWGGACSAATTSTCDLTVDAAKNVTASFVALDVVSVTVGGNGTGTVSVDVGGIRNCGSPNGVCSASYDDGSRVTLVATATAGTSERVSWGAGCASVNGNSCVITASANLQISVSFINTVSFMVLKSNNATAAAVNVVNSTQGVPSGTSGTTLTFDTGTLVTLQARPGNGNNLLFSSWSGVACSAGNFLLHDCTFTAAAGQANITASFVAQPYNTAFVSSTTFPSTLGGARAYDSQCNKLASNAGINNSANSAFFAFMSDDKSNAVDQFTQVGSTAQGFGRMDGQPIANTVGDLTSGTVYFPILFDETGANASTPGQPVYTWTGSDSTGRNSLNYNCASWTAAGPSGSGVFGGEVSAGPSFGSSVGFSAGQCNSSLRIFCFEKDKVATIAVPTATGKMIFLSPVAAGGGTASFDKACLNARPTGSASNFLALISTSTVSAAKHALVVDQTYVTPSGVFIGLGKDVAQGQGHWNTGVWQSSTGAFSSSGAFVLTGAPTPSQSGTVSSTCSDWSDFSTKTYFATGGLSTETALLWSFNSVPCTDYFASPPRQAYVYCVEQ